MDHGNYPLAAVFLYFRKIVKIKNTGKASVFLLTFNIFDGKVHLYLYKKGVYMSLKLTDKVVARFRGGQMEIMDPGRSPAYRGEIETIAIKDGKLVVTFSWFAKGEGFLPRRWTKEDRVKHEVDLVAYTASYTHPSKGENDKGNKIGLYCSTTGEIFMLYPPGSNGILPLARIEGFEAAKAHC